MSLEMATRRSALARARTKSRRNSKSAASLVHDKSQRWVEVATDFLNGIIGDEDVKLGRVKRKLATVKRGLVAGKYTSAEGLFEKIIEIAKTNKCPFPLIERCEKAKHSLLRFLKHNATDHVSDLPPNHAAPTHKPKRSKEDMQEKASPSANPKKKRKTRAKSKARSSAKTSSPSPPKTSTYTLTHKRKRKETKSKYNKTKNQLPPTTASNAGLNLAEKNSLDSTRDSTNSNISASTPSIPTHANVDRTRVRENATMPGVGGSTEVSKLPKIVSPTRRVLKRARASIAIPNASEEEGGLKSLEIPGLSNVTASGIGSFFSFDGFGATATTGFKSVNQDTLRMRLLFGSEPLAGVFDGHGKLGHLAAEVCSKVIPEWLGCSLAGEQSNEDAIYGAFEHAQSLLVKIAEYEQNFIRAYQSHLQNLDKPTQPKPEPESEPEPENPPAPPNSSTKASRFRKLRRIFKKSPSYTPTESEGTAVTDSDKRTPTPSPRERESVSEVSKEKKQGVRPLNMDYGSTASLCFLDRSGKRLYIAHVGDSKCMVLRRKVSGSDSGSGSGSGSDSTQWRLVHETDDHNCHSCLEMKGVIERGGAVNKVQGDYRVYPKELSFDQARRRCLSLNMSRSLGHLIMSKDAGISHIPDISKINLQIDSEYLLVMASDGLWDHIHHGKILPVITKHIKPCQNSDATQRKRQLEFGVDELMVRATEHMERVSFGDNVTVLIMRLMPKAKIA